MVNRYPQALREQIVLESHLGRSIRALANDYEPCEATIQQWIEREMGGAATRPDESRRTEAARQGEPAVAGGQADPRIGVAWFPAHRNEP